MFHITAKMSLGAGLGWEWKVQRAKMRTHWGNKCDNQMATMRLVSTAINAKDELVLFWGNIVSKLWDNWEIVCWVNQRMLSIYIVSILLHLGIFIDLILIFWEIY